MKKWQVIIIAVLAALIALLLAKDFVVKISVEKGIEIVTGLKLNIKSLNVGVFRSAVSIKGLKVFNPPQFKDRVMIDMPEIYVDYDLPAILGGSLHLRTLRLNLKEFIVVKNEKGELNLNYLKVVKAKKEGVRPETKGGRTPNILIDSFELKIDKAFYKNYSVAGGPAVKEYNVNLSERYTNITNPYALISIIVVKAIGNTSISGLTNFDINGLRGTVKDTLSTAQKTAARAANIAQKAWQNTTQGTGSALKDPGATVEKAAGALGDLFTGAVREDSK